MAPVRGQQPKVVGHPGHEVGCALRWGSRRCNARQGVCAPIAIGRLLTLPAGTQQLSITGKHTGRVTGVAFSYASPWTLFSCGADKWVRC